MKKRLIIIISIIISLLVIGLIIFLCNIDKLSKQNGVTQIITASKISSEPEATEKTFTYDGYEFIYYNVYKSDANEFVIKDGGYIKTVGFCGAFNLKFHNNEYITVYLLNEESDISEPIKEVNSLEYQGKAHYDLELARNYIIMFDSNGNLDECNIGLITFTKHGTR